MYRAGYATSEIARMFPDQAPSPSCPEQVTPLGISFFVIADRDRPDRAFAVTAVFVAIVQRDLPSFVNLRARPRHVDAVSFLLPGRAGAARRFKHKRS